jgi:FixJ family two-component response regulator
MSSTEPTVFVIDDEASMRRAITRLLASAGFATQGYASAGDFLADYEPSRPGCLMLDLAMPGLSGLELQQILRARGMSPPIIFLTGHAEIADSVKAMKGGAVEFLTKPVEDEELIAAVRDALAKDALARGSQAQIDAIRERLASLTPREHQVLRCVIAGKLNKQTAAELGTVEKTIKVHRARVIEKMQVGSAAELALLVAKAGIHPDHDGWPVPPHGQPDDR